MVLLKRLILETVIVFFSFVVISSVLSATDKSATLVVGCEIGFGVCLTLLRAAGYIFDFWLPKASWESLFSGSLDISGFFLILRTLIVGQQPTWHHLMSSSQSSSSMTLTPSSVYFWYSWWENRNRAWRNRCSTPL